MKEQEENELSGEAAPPAEDAAAVKPSEETNGDGDGEEAAAGAVGGTGDDVAAPDPPGPDGGGGGNNINSGHSGPQACETAQGALGQVKAKVEVCKDESVGECLLSGAAGGAESALQDLTCVHWYITSLNAASLNG